MFLSSFDCCFRARSLLIMTFMFFYPVLSTPSRLESSCCQCLLLDRMSRCLFTLDESEEQNRMHCEAIRNHRKRRRGIEISCVKRIYTPISSKHRIVLRHNDPTDNRSTNNIPHTPLGYSLYSCCRCSSYSCSCCLCLCS